MDDEYLERWNDLQKKLDEGIDRAGRQVDEFLLGEEPELDQYFMPVLEEKKKKGRPKKVREEEFNVDSIMSHLTESQDVIRKYSNARKRNS